MVIGLDRFGKGKGQGADGGGIQHRSLLKLGSRAGAGNTIAAGDLTQVGFAQPRRR